MTQETEMMKPGPSHALLALLPALLFGATAMAQDSSPSPSALRETHQDWTVSCATQGQTRRCAFSQQQRQRNGRRILAVEFIPARDGALTGTLVLPFGLALDRGVTLGLDQAAPGAPLPFKTCLAAGCIVPITVTAAMGRSFRGGASLKLNMVASDTGQPIAFSLSLKGFGAALDRTVALLR